MRSRHLSGPVSSFVTGVFLSALILPGSQEKAKEQTDAAGKGLVERICVGCHELDVVTAGRRTKMAWRDNVDDMMSRGAEGTPQEMAAVVAYLTKNFGMINVNTASASELQEFLSLSEKDAQAITAYRDRVGKFKNFDELKSVPGTNSDKLQEKRGLIAFSQ
jgi:competence protein ComEA